jgi:Protein of unknown function (DUF4038)/Putative collagen-binding domain of a collagenase
MLWRPKTPAALWLSLALAAVLVVAAGAAVAWMAGLLPPEYDGQELAIPDSQPETDTPSPLTTLPAPTVTREARYVTAVSTDGRFFVDQHGEPILVRGDAPWSLMVDVSSEDAERYLSTRAAQGFNAALVSLIGSVANGGPSDDGATYDGLLPFVSGDVLSWNEGYWQRAHSYLVKAANHGITVFLYPIDGWTIGNSFVPASLTACHEYGMRVARYFAALPNIVWMTGGDYFPATDDLAAGSDVDHCMDAALQGIRDADDSRPFSIQLNYDRSWSTQNPFWAPRVDWNFVYTYHPTYEAVLKAYRAQPVLPALFGEGNYEGENNQDQSPPTTAETLRRQVLWALTSGSPGDIFGTDDWEFLPGWQGRLDSEATRQVSRLRALVEALPWWELVPDDGEPIVTAGRGEQVTDDAFRDVLESDYVTAASTPDGTTALVYVPTSREITVDISRFAEEAEAYWIDPTTTERIPTRLATRMNTPARNSEGDTDWLLLVQSP